MESTLSYLQLSGIADDFKISTRPTNSLKARWGASENNRRAKYYELSRSGRKQLEAEESAWKKLAAAVARVLETG